MVVKLEISSKGLGYRIIVNCGS